MEPPLRVASIGECMIELNQDGPGRFAMKFGGDSLNMALYMARLLHGRGAVVDYMSALGDDPYSDAMAEFWRSEGVGLNLLARLPGRLPGLYAIKTDAAGERGFHYWRSAAAARDMFRTPQTERVLRQLQDYDLIYFTGITLSILDPESLGRLLKTVERARRAGARIAFDGNYRPHGWTSPEAAREAMTAALRRADVALPTLGDEQALFGDADAAATAARMADLGVEEIVVKRDAAPCLVVVGDARFEVAASAVADPVDTTAAGDSFNAGYLAARLTGAGPRNAALAGHQLAAAVIRHKGAVIDRAAMPRIRLGDG